MFRTFIGQLAGAVALFTLTASVAMAAAWNTNAGKVVLDGYDVVAYHTEDRAVKGLSRYTARFDGVKFQFATKANMDAFVKTPAVYAPKYNGFCAFAVGAKGAKVPANPDSFKLYNGELLVFFNDLYKATSSIPKCHGTPTSENCTRKQSKIGSH